MHWDPTPDDRSYFRSATTGDLGWVVRREGKDRIRLDRPAQEIILPFNDGNGWIVENELRPMTVYQAAQVAFEADRTLCRALGLYKEAKREWMSLTDAERIDWVDNGPKKPTIRVEVYKANRKALAPYAK